AREHFCRGRDARDRALDGIERSLAARPHNYWPVSFHPDWLRGPAENDGGSECRGMGVANCSADAGHFVSKLAALSRGPKAERINSTSRYATLGPAAERSHRCRLPGTSRNGLSAWSPGRGGKGNHSANHQPGPPH